MEYTFNWRILCVCFFLIFFCLLKEYLFSLRRHRSKKGRKINDTIDEGHNKTSLLNKTSSNQTERLLNTALYLMNLFLGYLIMLVVMVSNVGFILVICFSSSLGYYLFQSDEGHSNEPEPDCCEK